MGSAEHSRSPTNHGHHSPSEFFHTSLHPEPEHPLSAHLPGDVLDGPLADWEHAWIDLGGEG
jgi:hypothetical protein